jgi:hypothetical protein
MQSLSFLLNPRSEPPSHVDLFSDLCPNCYCNGHLAYEFQGSTTKPSTVEEWSEWWDCGDDYEEPFISRPMPIVHWSIEEKRKIISVFTPNIQRVIMARMLPDFHKHARRVAVGSLFTEVYNFWIEELIKNMKPTKDGYRNASIPTHRDERRVHKLRKTTWVGTMPNLGENWHRKKWIGDLGHVFRTQISEITFTHNSWNNLVFVDFIFNVEHHDGNKWNPN